VLRKHQDRLDYFVRVTFSDEDGEMLQFRFDTSNDDVYGRYQAILDNSLPLCGRTFQFLGSPNGHFALKLLGTWRHSR
jgi:hypothetical protein